jgi:hypothetical protein
MDTREYEIVAFPLRDYGKLDPGHRHGNRQLSQLQRTTAIGMLANQVTVSTAQYTMSRLSEELRELTEKIGLVENLTPYQRARLQQVTLICMVRLGQNSVQLNDRLMEILLR